MSHWIVTVIVLLAVASLVGFATLLEVASAVGLGRHSGAGQEVDLIFQRRLRSYNQALLPLYLVGAIVLMR